MTAAAGSEVRARGTYVGAGRMPPMRVVLLAAASAALVWLTAIILVPVACLTCFRARSLYAGCARVCCLAILRLYGITIRVHQRRPFPRSQCVYVSNHSSTLDLFVLVALGLPNCRFFLSGFLRKYVPLGYIAWLMGTFFTVPQNRPAERSRIFQAADRELRRTGESVYLSPEGGRVATGRIGPFNKGAFHLATSLQAPIVPLYFSIPRSCDPGLGFDARSGTVDVHVLPAVDTRRWTLGDLDANRERVRQLFVRVHEEGRNAS
jgi:1-acyl-sn-glycerol-3-phosphate acyltransferase